MRTRSFQPLVGYLGRAVTLAGDGDPVELTVAQVSAGYLDAIGTRPALGRAFSGEDARRDRGNLRHRTARATV